MKKESAKERLVIVAKNKRLMRLGRVAMEYRRQLLREVEAIKRAIGEALMKVGKQKNPTCLAGRGVSVESDEFNVLVAKTFNSGLPEKSVGLVRQAFSDPEGFLVIVLKDIVVLREYLLPLIRFACPPIPAELEKVKVV